MSNLLLFLDISSGELLVILLVAFLLFGPKQMKDMTKKAGKFIAKLKNESEKLKKEINDD